jgi:hypothetical protein
VRILQLFKHEHGELREPQLAGQEQADRAGTCDDHVVDQVSSWLGLNYGTARPVNAATERSNAAGSIGFAAWS